MQIHVDEQTVEVEAGRITLIFNIVDTPMADETETTTAPVEVVEAPVETPVEAAPEVAAEVPAEAVAEVAPAEAAA